PSCLDPLGVATGATVAGIGTIACTCDPYWPRLAGARIPTQLYEPTPPLFPYLAAMPNREQAYDVARREGAKVLVGYFDPSSMSGTKPASAGWRELGQTHFYALPLNLPNETTQNPQP